MQKLSPEAEKLSNLKMWLQEQIERYTAQAKRFNINGTAIPFESLLAMLKEALARLTEDEK
jgi:thioesterase domain-containing protein